MTIELPTETEQLARLLAFKAGTSVEEILRQAIEARAREAGIDVAAPKQPRKKPDFDRLMAISERAAARPILDPRSRDEIIGYDQFGVPE